MKKLVIIFISTFLLTNTNSFSEETRGSIIEKDNCKNKFSFKNAFKRGKNCKGKEKISSASRQKEEPVQKNPTQQTSNLNCKKNFSWKNAFKSGKNCKGGEKTSTSVIQDKDLIEQANNKTNSYNNSFNNISFYTGTFDVIDKEGDDKSNLFGLEHRNPGLFRNTILGKFSPLTGAFMTGDSSVYLYTGIEGQYGIGPLKILPSFAPGYYEKGDGKDLGSVLEFKSELKVGLDIFENSKISYSYSHISNNDWGEKNPGTDNQQITFSKNF